MEASADMGCGAESRPLFAEGHKGFLTEAPAWQITPPGVQDVCDVPQDSRGRWAEPSQNELGEEAGPGHRVLLPNNQLDHDQDEKAQGKLDFKKMQP
ncbi:Methylthioribulose-1-phosphate dehydratase [Clarias magur]|uniref:Methylthioribulose-1-phosphate dehydratase n=1 Tax=Clarias magur TaxID=1594786 RepID=A0A8J5BNS9_CLAMG|nr:Methylthioribulose-1-phosphate dehydratase [Clarias magur]